MWLESAGLRGMGSVCKTMGGSSGLNVPVDWQGSGWQALCGLLSFLTHRAFVGQGGCMLGVSLRPEGSRQLQGCFLYKRFSGSCAAVRSPLESTFCAVFGLFVWGHAIMSRTVLCLDVCGQQEVDICVCLSILDVCWQCCAVAAARKCGVLMARSTALVPSV